MATAFKGGNACLWRLNKNAKFEKEYKMPHGTSCEAINHFSIQGESKIITAGMNLNHSTLKVWDYKKKQLVNEFKIHSSQLK